MLPSFGMDFALKFGGEDQKNKKKVFFANLRLLDHVHSICFAVSEKKAFVVICFGQKFAGPLVLVQKFTFAWEAQGVIWEGTAQKATLCA